MFTESLDFSYCLLSTTHLQSPPLTPAATLGRNHLDSSQHLALPTSLSRRVWRPYGKPKNRQPSLILHAPWGCLRSLGFPGLALSLCLPQEHIPNSAYAFYHEAPGWCNTNRKGDHLLHHLLKSDTHFTYGCKRAHKYDLYECDFKRESSSNAWY